MMLTEAEQLFVDRRRRLTQSWPFVGSGILVLLGSLVVWLVASKPLLANPFYVMSEIDRGTIEQSTLTLMAGMLPLAIWAVLFLCIATVTLAFSVFSNERRYLALLEKCAGGQTPNNSLQARQP